MTDLILPRRFHINANRKAKAEKFNQGAVNKLVRESAEFLGAIHPRWNWQVSCSADCSMITVECADLSGGKMGYAIHTKELQRHDDKKKMLHRAAGEMFERYGVSPFRHEEFQGERDKRNNPVAQT